MDQNAIKGYIFIELLSFEQNTPIVLSTYLSRYLELIKESFHLLAVVWNIIFCRLVEFLLVLVKLPDTFSSLQV